MSICIRTISNKLTPFVGTGKPITRLDRQLPKHIKETSAFLQEFLAAAVTANSQAREPITTFNLMIKPLKTSENIVSWNYKLKRDGNWNIGKSNEKSIEDVTRRFSNKICTRDASKTDLSIGNEDRAVQLEEKPAHQREDISQDGNEKPSHEHLNHVFEVLRKDLPAFFIKSVDYSIYHTMIVFENNIKGTVTKGIYEYVKQTAMLRILGHVKFAYVKFDVLKITAHPEDNTVKVRWRIRGLSGYKVLFNFWKYKLWKVQSTVDQLESWYDGFSTFYVDDTGKVIKHVADKMMPDQDTELSTKDKSNMAAKLALFLGLLTPREFFADIALLMSTRTKLERDKEC